MIPAISEYEGMSITFQVTEDCNLRCKYCYEIDKRPGDLPFEYAQKFIDIILEDDDPISAKGTDNEWILNEGLILDFIGGDALMVPELLDKIIQYYQYKAVSLGHRWAYRWRASISSNGTLFEKPQVRELLLKYKNSLYVGVSVDGCPEIHDKNRVWKDGRGTMKDIQKWWDWYIEWIGQDWATTKATCNKDTIPYLYKSIKFLHEEMRLKQIHMNFIFEDMHLTEGDLRRLDQEMEKTVAYILEHRHDLHVSMFDKAFGIGEPMSHPDKNWCGSGSMPCLSINGKIYPCFRFSPNTMHSRKLDFYVGDIWHGFSHKERFEMVRQQTRQKISPQKCLECPVESACAWCIGGAFAEKGEFYRPTNICEVHKLQSKWAHKYWEEYDKLEGTKSFDERGLVIL
ncbi:radical SAM/SPASM domain-containing protein [Candidatus Termititenax aidoneus]|uniref:Radical SAM/SPASM domain-containing protein n=1 Tax=Termititenax aidoneus TaxID=2218524 RepID=A0A388TAD1_TERA1|nr:radical SAM/SPASM domain-containing protein [Candidatus Termititenax aidoneus]